MKLQEIVEKVKSAYYTAEGSRVSADISDLMVLASALEESQKRELELKEKLMRTEYDLGVVSEKWCELNNDFRDLKNRTVLISLEDVRIDVKA